MRFFTQTRNNRDAVSYSSVYYSLSIIACSGCDAPCGLRSVQECIIPREGAKSSGCFYYSTIHIHKCCVDSRLNSHGRWRRPLTTMPCKNASVHHAVHVLNLKRRSNAWEGSSSGIADTVYSTPSSKPSRPKILPSPYTPVLP